jgi:propionyl-CoA carboxylase beta chain
MFVTGPQVVKTVTHETVTTEELGGARVHASKSGVAHFTRPGDAEALGLVRRLFSFLPLNNREEAPSGPSEDDPERESPELNDLVPASPNKPYDIQHVISAVVDHGDFLEVHEHYARNLVVGFARMEGATVGIVANQPAHLAGTLGTAQEHGGIIKHGAKLLYAYCEATVPRITVITRKAYGGAYDVMNSKHIRGDLNLAWPTAEIAVMGPAGAVEIIFRKELQGAKDADAEKPRLVKEYEEHFANPYEAAKRGFIDDVIEPAHTRRHLVRALRLLRTKRDENPPKKHGNLPL